MMRRSKQRVKRRGLILFTVFLVLFFLFFPKTVSAGAKEGLALWFYTVMPALLPFMIISGFMMKERITEPLNRLIGPFLSRLFAIPYRCAYPVVIGFLSGFPVGAKVTGQMYFNQEITREEAEYLLSFCNNASPMFLISYIGVECLHLRMPVEIFIFIVFSAWIQSFYTRKKYHMHSEPFPGSVFRKKNSAFSGKGAALKQVSRPGVVEALDESIMDSFLTITKIGGYILLFSILIQMIQDFIPIDHSLKYIGIGFLEITTGGKVFSGISLAPWLKYGIFVGLCAFGGISSIFQTA
ncbi:MAG: hypothetical protein IJ733_09275, partial [Lachnospiraceae bacterium]|nr:hypothetical protein [Lachnospiraceae bacterium]